MVEILEIKFDQNLCKNFDMTKEVTLVSRTQPSGPLCLWQCFNFTLARIINMFISRIFITSYSLLETLLCWFQIVTEGLSIPSLIDAVLKVQW